jgi:hypothetical protein
MTEGKKISSYLRIKVFAAYLKAAFLLHSTAACLD